MPVVITIFDKSVAEPWNCGAHEFADEAAEICSHHERFKPMYSFSAELSINETQKSQKLFHALLNVVDG